MKSSVLQRTSFILMVLTHLVQFGCAGIPPSTEHQDSLGAIAVVTTKQAPNIEFEGFPKSRSSASAGMGGGFLLSCVSASGQGGAVGFILFLPVCAVGSVGVGVYGAAATDPQEINASETVITEAFAISAIQGLLRDHVIAAIKTDGTLVVKESTELQVSGEIIDYSDYAARDIETVLEVSVIEAGTKSLEGWWVDPLLTLYMIAKVRLIRTSDSKDIFSTEYEYLGQSLKLAEWSADDGLKLKNGIMTLYERLGNHIYESIFLLYPLPDREAQATGFIRFIHGLEPISPSLEYGFSDAKFPAWAEVDNLKPTFQWQSFPRPFDKKISPDDMSRLQDVRYDLVIAKSKNNSPYEIIYERQGLTNTTHIIENALEENIQYLWTVRARFLLDGRERVTEWGVIATQETQDFFAGNQSQRYVAPNPFSYRFMTTQ